MMHLEWQPSSQWLCENHGQMGAGITTPNLQFHSPALPSAQSEPHPDPPPSLLPPSAFNAYTDAIEDCSIAKSNANGPLQETNDLPPPSLFITSNAVEDYANANSNANANGSLQEISEIPSYQHCGQPDQFVAQSSHLLQYDFPEQLRLGEQYIAQSNVGCL